MRVVIIFNHPYKGSYCNAILDAVKRGLDATHHTIDLIHLDNDGFNPIMTEADLLAFKNRHPVDPKVIEYKQRLDLADHLIFIFPIWWELMPAMMKGFIDKVIFPGVAYDYKPNGFMEKRWKHLKSITLITTMNTPHLMYKILFGNAIKRAVFVGTFWKMGYKNRKWISFNMVKTVSNNRRKKWLSKLEDRFSKAY